VDYIYIYIGKGIGFLADIRRMNVALTRAKFALWVVGNSQMLSQNSHWKQFIDFAKENNFCINFDFFSRYHTITQDNENLSAN
jgi:senataxin